MEIYDSDTDRSFVPASELFTISSGIRTGNNDVYVHDYSFMHVISDEEKLFFKPVVVGHFKGWPDKRGIFRENNHENSKNEAAASRIFIR